MNSKDYECTAFAPKYMIERPDKGQEDEYLEKLKVLVTTYALLEARELANAEE